MKELIKITSILLVAFAWVSNVFVEKASVFKPGEAVKSDTLKKDAETGLIADPNFYMVKAQCTSCHSSKLIIQNRFTRDGWKQKIRWMQAKHNLWDLGETEKQVLDYLEKNYSPTASVARRTPLKNIQWYKLDQK
ncbi:hypothetical protein [Dyadobacter sp. CY323]|uniref:hypothetical protein n=1 Tax=Dyadobacter sp. CY323 TaxID=2907302 RepID=UPI001F285A29|nr:hypothetical protein [Dyadobacter sp. CY323]MCE6992305.1 hypothetical protein [Dyadobacter sp. CY323]